MTIKEAFSQFLEGVVDLKHQLVMISTVLFYLGKMTEVGWITFVLSVTGFRFASEIMDVIKSVKDATDIKLASPVKMKGNKK